MTTIQPWGLVLQHAEPKCKMVTKLIMARESLSVQVHPSAAETWYVVDADVGAVIYAGLKLGVSRFDLLNNPVECLNAVPASEGQVFIIPAGTVHAIGAGVTVLESKEFEDVTYRLYDWGRDREIHVEQALACVDYERGPIFPVRF